MAQLTRHPNKNKLNVDHEKDLMPTCKHIFDVAIEGHSICQLQQDLSLAHWQLPNDSVLLDHIDATSADAIRENNLLSHAVLVDVRVKDVKSNFPYALSVKIPGVTRRHCVTRSGTTCHLVVKENADVPVLNECLLDDKNKLTKKYFQENQAFMQHKFDSGILERQNNSEYKYVPVKHPVVQYVRRFSSEYQNSLGPPVTIEGTYFHKIESRIIDSARSYWSTRYKDYFQVCDLSKFRVEIERADGRCFHDLTGICDATLHSEETIRHVTHMPRTFSTSLEVTYFLHQ